jgi:hypothetical protein
MQALISYPLACWTILVQIAPALLLGFVAAGIISAFLSEAFVKRHLGGGGLWPVVKAALIGVPMPLCSCGVLPVATALKRSGASRGALVAFLISVPQTGADNMLVVWSMLGALFAIYSPISAFLSGIFGGTLCQLFGEEHGEKAKDGGSSGEGVSTAPAKNPKAILEYSFTTLVDEIAGALVVGILIAAAISILIPDGWMARYLGPGAGSMLLMLVVGLSIYVCSSGSVPIAAAFVAKGASPGAALVFLISGPASNSSAIAVLFKLLGLRNTMIYLGSLGIFAFASGFLLNWLYTLFPHSEFLAVPQHVHGTEGSSLFGTLCAVFLLFLLAYSILKRFKTQEKPVKPDGAIVLKVEGMSCNHCANTVRLALESVSGIASARVDLKAGIAYLTPLDPSKAPRMDELLKALEANGFKGSDGDRTDS